MTIVRSEISHNSAAVDGGGLFRSSGGGLVLTVRDSTFSENSAGRDGGGINVALLSSSGASATVERSTLRGNLAGRSGGGIFKNGTGSFTMVDSTISGNVAELNGGGAAADKGPFTLTNSTLGGNSAGALGGGVWAGQAATLNHTTVFANNAGAAGGGAFTVYGPLTLNHAVIAGNTAPAGRDLTGLLGAIIEARYSLIGNNTGSGLAEAPIGAPDANGNRIGGPIHGVIDPRLGPLVANGGPTLTHAPLPGSPVINAGDPAASPGASGVPVNDQRGAPFTRVYGGRIDMGAVESQPNPLPGDYNFNGVVDMADYILWRDTAGSTSDLRADGNGDGIVNEADRLFWRTHFGENLQQTASMLAFSAVGFTQVTRPPINLQTGLSPARVEAKSVATSLSFATPPSKSVKRPAVTRSSASASSDEAVRRDSALAALFALELRNDQRSLEPFARQVARASASASAAGEIAKASTTQASTVDEVFKTLENTRRRVISRR